MLPEISSVILLHTYNSEALGAASMVVLHRQQMSTYVCSSQVSSAQLNSELVAGICV